MVKKLFLGLLSLMMIASSLAAIPVFAAANVPDDLILCDFESPNIRTYTTEAIIVKDESSVVGSLDKIKLYALSSSNIATIDLQANIGDKTESDKAVVYTLKGTGGTSYFGDWGDSTSVSLDWGYFGSSTLNVLTVEYQLFNNTDNTTFDFRCHDNANHNYGCNTYNDPHWNFTGIRLSKGVWHDVAIEFIYNSATSCTANLYIDGKIVDVFNANSTFYPRHPYLHINTASGDTGYVAVDNYAVYQYTYNERHDYLNYDFDDLGNIGGNGYEKERTASVSYGSIPASKDVQNYSLAINGSGWMSADTVFENGVDTGSIDGKAWRIKINTDSAPTEAYFGPSTSAAEIGADLFSDNTPIVTVQYDIYDTTENSNFYIQCHDTAEYMSTESDYKVNFKSSAINIPNNKWVTLSAEFHYKEKYVKIYVDGVLYCIDSTAGTDYISYPFLRFDGAAADAPVDGNWSKSAAWVDNYRVYAGEYDGIKSATYTDPEFSESADKVSVSMNAWNDTNAAMPSCSLIIASYVGGELAAIDIADIADVTGTTSNPETFTAEIDAPVGNDAVVNAYLFDSITGIKPLMAKMTK